MRPQVSARMVPGESLPKGLASSPHPRGLLGAEGQLVRPPQALVLLGRQGWVGAEATISP